VLLGNNSSESQSKHGKSSCSSRASHEALAKQLLGENQQLAVHLLTDDPAYVRWFKKVFASPMAERPPRVTLGVQSESEELREGASYERMTVAQPKRMTSLTSFFKDVWLMVQCSKFFPTQGSTVTGVVAGYRLALRLPANEQPPIGSWQGYERPSRWSMKQVRDLLQLVSASDFDPTAQHMNAAQREVLRKFSDVDCCKLGAFLAENMARRGPNPSTWISQLYQTNKQIADNRAKFQTAFSAGAAETGVKHWLGAVLAHRVNNYLLRNGSKYVWQLHRAVLQQVPLAFSDDAASMMDAGGQDAGTAGEPALSTGSAAGSGMETAASASAGPAKRQRAEGAPLLPSSSKAGSMPSAPTSAPPPKRWGSPVPAGAKAKPRPKPMPPH